MHSVSVGVPVGDITDLCLFITSGITFEKYRFGGWGVDRGYPEVVLKRGQLGFFCDSWNKKCTAVVDRKTLLSPERKCNGPIRNLH